VKLSVLLLLLLLLLLLVHPDPPQEIVATRHEVRGWKRACMQADAQASKLLQEARRAAAADAAKAAVQGFAGAATALSTVCTRCAAAGMCCAAQSADYYFLHWLARLSE
jgi:hypothetical protein